jgi:hypothetical protein
MNPFIPIVPILIKRGIYVKWSLPATGFGKMCLAFAVGSGGGTTSKATFVERPWWRGQRWLSKSQFTCCSNTCPGWQPGNDTLKWKVLFVNGYNNKSPILTPTQFNLIKPTGYVMQHQVYHPTTVRCAHAVFVCFVFIWEQTAIISLYSINWLVFITEMKSVHCAVRTGSLNIAVCASSFEG